MRSTHRNRWPVAAVDAAVWQVRNGVAPSEAADAAGLPRWILSWHLRAAGVPDLRPLAAARSGRFPAPARPPVPPAGRPIRSYFLGGRGV